MSTAIAVSAFYDVDISCSNQNRRNMHNHRTGMLSTADQPKTKAVGTPITGANRNRNILLERSLSEPVDRNSNQQVMQQQQQANRTNVNSSRYKTELCRPFEENGYCKYGDKCQFAHGMHDLRSLARHPKYKTELCRTFHTIGFCPYGPRCHFMHNDEDRVNMVKADQQQQGAPQCGPQQQQPAVHHGRLSPPHPRAARFPLALPITRDSLGSAADSPTSSVTDSPVMSPTFVGDNDMLMSNFNGFNPPMSAPPITGNPFRTSFSFHHLSQPQAPLSGLMSPLNIRTDPIASLSADMQAVMLQDQQQNQRNNMNLLNSLQLQKPVDMFGLAGFTGLENNPYAPPSPPDSLSGDSSSSSSSMSTSSMCGSPLEMSRALRLPIFTTLSHE